MSDSYLVLSFGGFPFNEIVDQYHSIRQDIASYGKKKAVIPARRMKELKIKLDNYQQKLDTMRTMIVNSGRDSLTDGINYKLWAIEKHHNFINARKKWGI